MDCTTALLPGLHTNYLLCPSRHSSSLLSKTHFPSPLKLQLQTKQLSFAS
ncbi:hypothetical protein CsatB_008369 [Cannabis sativa]